MGQANNTKMVSYMNWIVITVENGEQKNDEIEGTCWS